jgi:ABC-type phosphate transport system substrate-binding protein
MFFQKAVDFGCSDPPLSRDTWLKYSGSVPQVPWFFGPVVVVYSLRVTKGVLGFSKVLRFSRSFGNVAWRILVKL